MRVPLIIVLSAVAAWCGTTNVRIYHQAVASPASVQSRQVGVNTTADANLGFKMWFGKDADGNVTQFLAKSKKALVLNLSADTCKVKATYSARDTSVFHKSDSSYIGGLKADRFYFGTLTGDTISVKKLHVDSCLQLPIRLNDCTSDGALWYQENHGAVHSYIDGIIGTLNRTLFVQSNTVLDSNSTLETSLIGTSPNHALDSFPANYFVLGKTHHFTMSGIYSTKSNPAGTLTIRIKLNAAVICSTIVTLDASETDQQWMVSGYNVCLDTGVTGKFRVNTGFEHTIAGVEHSDKITTPNGGAIVNTKIKLNPDFTFKFSTADVSNKIKSTQFIIDELH